MKFWRIASVFLLAVSVLLHLASYFPELQVNFYKVSFLLCVLLMACVMSSFYYIFKVGFCRKDHGGSAKLRWFKFPRWMNIAFASVLFFSFWYFLLDQHIYQGDQAWKEEDGYFYARYIYRPEHPEYIPKIGISKESYYKINAELMKSQTKGYLFLGEIACFLFFCVLPIRLDVANNKLKR